MGFFQDLKQDLSQAVNELTTEEVELETASELSSADDLFGQADSAEFKELEAMLEEEISAIGEQPVQEEVIPEEVKEEVVEELKLENEQEKEEMEELLNEVEMSMAQESSYAEEASFDNKPVETFQTMAEISTDTAVITAGMTITGDICSSGNMDLIGSINGNIDIQGKLNVTGSVNGNSSAAEIYAESAQINGEVKSKGSVKIGQSSVVIGNIYATSAVIAGAVKGDIDVHGPVILDTSAIVMGNIKSKSVQINNGAVIEGMCSQCYADVSPTSFFNDVKKSKKAV